MRNLVLPLLVIACASGCDPSAPHPQIKIDRTQLFVGQTLEVDTYWEGECGSLYEPEACNRQPYTVSITCDGSPCVVTPYAAPEIYYVTPSGPAKMTVTMTDTATGEVHAETSDLDVITPRSLVLGCWDLDANASCASPIAYGTKIAVTAQVVADDGGTYQITDYDPTYSWTGNEPTNCTPSGPVAGGAYACTWWDGIEAWSTLSIGYRGLSATIDLRVQ
jgi:hypothetical protein